MKSLRCYNQMKDIVLYFPVSLIIKLQDDPYFRGCGIRIVTRLKRIVINRSHIEYQPVSAR